MIKQIMQITTIVACMSFPQISQSMDAPKPEGACDASGCNICMVAASVDLLREVQKQERLTLTGMPDREKEIEEAFSVHKSKTEWCRKEFKCNRDQCSSLLNNDAKANIASANKILKNIEEESKKKKEESKKKK